jgi:hypothetical protein
LRFIGFWNINALGFTGFDDISFLRFTDFGDSGFFRMVHESIDLVRYQKTKII